VIFHSYVKLPEAIVKQELGDHWFRELLAV
jgi:hypothetical protein